MRRVDIIIDMRHMQTFPYLARSTPTARSGKCRPCSTSFLSQLLNLEISTSPPSNERCHSLLYATSYLLLSLAVGDTYHYYHIEDARWQLLSPRSSIPILSSRHNPIPLLLSSSIYTTLEMRSACVMTSLSGVDHQAIARVWSRVKSQEARLVEGGE